MQVCVHAHSEMLYLFRTFALSNFLIKVTSLIAQ